MRPLEYKGYQATVSYEDGCLVIQVLHVTDHIVAECTDATKVQAEFESLIDQYIADCADIGKEPEKPFKGVFNVRTSPDLHRKCAKQASRLGITLNEMVCQALEASIGAASLHERGDWASLVGGISPSVIVGKVQVSTVARARGVGSETKELVYAWSKAAIPLRQH